jgi:polyhydroxyalkanoate synthase
MSKAKTDPSNPQAEVPQAAPKAPPDPVELARTMMRIGEQSQKVMREFLERQKTNDASTMQQEAVNISSAFLEMTQHLIYHPMKMVEAGLNLWQDTMRLWHGTTLRMLGNQTVEPVIAPPKGDRRFMDKAWSENALFDFIKQSYLLSSRWMQNVVKDTDGLDAHTARKVDFYTRQFVDAISPSNFLMTNPEVLRKTMETGGENLIRGLENLLKDMERGDGALKIAMTDEKAFSIGQNIATMPGKIIFQNEMMQLIQYEPLTEKVHAVPLLIIPPWINKYYILDLGEKKSMVRWLAQQGYTVFMISWVNPDESLKDKDFSDYLVDGPVAALQQIQEAIGVREVNVVGYCLGGTLLAILLAWLHDNAEMRKKLPTILSGTYFVTMLDFKEAGEISVFIDEEQIETIEDRMKVQGYLDARSLATTFNLLRSNDLIWSFVVNNYLMGEEPFPFDLLYWNSDSTRLPAAMHSFYLREMYQKNKLVKPGAVKMKGIPIDLGKIETPAFFLSTREDHISPWRSTYAGAQLFRGDVTFTLSASGHIAGVINPPNANKYGHWVGTDGLGKTPETWLKSAAQQEGSWWPTWDKWLQQYNGSEVPARKPGDGNVTIIEDAPGSYVRVRS